jgi:hypothetical protein
MISGPVLALFRYLRKRRKLTERGDESDDESSQSGV